MEIVLPMSISKPTSSFLSLCVVVRINQSNKRERAKRILNWSKPSSSWTNLHEMIMNVTTLLLPLPLLLLTPDSARLSKTFKGSYRLSSNFSHSHRSRDSLILQLLNSSSAYSICFSLIIIIIVEISFSPNFIQQNSLDINDSHN
jgi:hypothetical protein